MILETGRQKIKIKGKSDEIISRDNNKKRRKQSGKDTGFGKGNSG